jgi:hypothetical protein
MSLRTYIFAMIGATLLAWIAWGVVVTGINPFEAGIPGVALFYVTLFVALIGTVSLGLSFIRVKLLKKGTVHSREIRTAFRHAILFALVMVVSLGLSAQGILQTWHLVVMVAVVVLVEQFFVRAYRA